jgi:hypothetical protein
VCYLCVCKRPADALLVLHSLLSGFIVVSQLCYSGFKVVLQWFHSGIRVVLQ